MTYFEHYTPADLALQNKIARGMSRVRGPAPRRDEMADALKYAALAVSAPAPAEPPKPAEPEDARYGSW